MAGTVTIGGVSVTYITGTLKHGSDHDDRGGGVLPHARHGFGVKGECQELADSVGGDFSDLVSGVGPANTAISGDASGVRCLVDVTVAGDAVQVATISWKGSKA